MRGHLLPGRRGRAPGARRAAGQSLAQPVQEPGAVGGGGREPGRLAMLLDDEHATGGLQRLVRVWGSG